MKTKADRIERASERRANANFAARQLRVQGLGFGAAGVPGFGFQDQRPGAVAQRKWLRSIAGSPRQFAQAERLSGAFGSAVQRVEGEEELLQGRFETVQRQGPEDEELLQGRFGTAGTAQLEAGAGALENRTGMPDELKSGVERLSGMDLSDVRVHRSSAKPAQLNALAYAQGNEIHLSPGQEGHLPHEAWHVVQQRQGRVRPTMQLAGVQVNDEVGLEREADLMGAKALNQP